MKRKTISALLALMLLLGLSAHAFATEPGAPAIVDQAGLLSPDEMAELTRQVNDQCEALELDIVIVTTLDLGGKDVQAYADDFYEFNGYGYGETASGILLLLSMETREWYMSTCGEAIYIFTDYGLECLGQEILPYLSDEDYFEAFSHWADSLSIYVESFRKGSPIDGYAPPDAYDSPYGEEIVYYESSLSPAARFMISLVVGLVAALVTVLVMRSSMNTARFQKGAVNYLKDGSFRLSRSHDMFLYSRVSRTAKPKNNSSGGSSVHRSSGGISHGGRGGRF